MSSFSFQFWLNYLFFVKRESNNRLSKTIHALCRLKTWFCPMHSISWTLFGGGGLVFRLRVVFKTLQAHSWLRICSKMASNCFHIVKVIYWTYRNVYRLAHQNGSDLVHHPTWPDEIDSVTLWPKTWISQTILACQNVLKLNWSTADFPIVPTVLWVHTNLLDTYIIVNYCDKATLD